MANASMPFGNMSAATPMASIASAERANSSSIVKKPAARTGDGPLGASSSGTGNDRKAQATRALRPTITKGTPGIVAPMAGPVEN